MRKFYSLFIALLTVCGLAKAQVTFDFTGEKAYEQFGLAGFSSTDSHDGDFTEDASLTSGDVTITVTESGKKDANRMWTGSMRLYGGTLTIASSGKNITAVDFELNNKKWGANTAEVGTLDTGKWTGDAASVVITIGGNTQIKKITVTLGGGDTPGPGPDPGEIDWTSSATSPLTVAQLQEKAAKLDGGKNSDKEVYVKGKISQIDEISPKLADGSGYGNATYYISDDGTTTNQFYVYRGKGLKGADFTTENDIKVGDNVVVVGVIKNYVKNEVSTLEFDQGNRLYSLNGDTGGDDPQPGDSKTIAEVIAGGAASAVVTSGTVYASCPNGIIIGDGTGYIYAYRPTETAAVGDVVKITGNVSQYGGCFQFGQGCTLEKTGTASVTYPIAKTIDGAGLDALVAAPVVTFVKVTGTLTISGNYKNLTVEGATNTGSLQVSDAVLGSAGDGDEIEVTGFFAYKSGSSTVYGNIVATEVKVVGDTPGPEVPEYTTIAAVKAAVTAEHVDIVFKANNLLVTFVNGKSVYVYDGKDGLLLYANDAKFNEGIKAGDKITADIKGQLYLYNGLTEIAVSAYENLTVNSSGNAVEPQKVTVADVISKARDYENELVQIEGLYAQAEALASRNVNFMDDSDNEIVVRDNFNVLTGTTFDTEAEYTVTGFVTIFTKDGTTTTQLYPRTPEDLDNGETPQPYELQGDGTLENPYTIADVLYLYSSNEAPAEAVWVKGTIIGAAKSTMNNIVKEQGEDLQPANIVLADAADETTAAKMIPVQLPAGKVRDALNLVDNFDNLNKNVCVYGTIEKYFTVAGVKGVTDYSMDGITTAISTVEATAAQGAIYTIAGQRIQHINHAGLYIVGGKKVAVK